MKDYNFIDKTGRRTPVSELSTSLIQELLREGVQVDDDEGLNLTQDNVLERLRIELTARELGLR